MQEKFESLYGSISPGDKMADLHIHTLGTKASPPLPNDAHMTIEEAIEWNNRLGLDAISITDHNTIASSEVAWNLKEQRNYPFEVILGSEVSSRDGHIVGLYLTADIPKGLSAVETIYKIHEQGGIAVIPHPGYKALSTSMPLLKCLDVAKEEMIDGFEVHSGGVAFQAEMRRRRGRTPTTANEKALEFYKEHQQLLGAPIGTSDNHYFVFGRVRTGYRDNLKEAILKRNTSVILPKDEELKKIFLLAYELFGDEKVPLQKIFGTVDKEQA